MNIFGREIRLPVPFRRKAFPALSPAGSGGWVSVLRESFTGAWQRNIEVESPQNILAFSAVYASVSLISDDISKLRIKLMKFDDKDSIWEEVTSNQPWLPVLRKPNRFQTRIQFLSQWLTSKLLHGNTYVLKERNDERGIVTALYVLDPRLVTPLVAEDGSVWYQINRDKLSGVTETITVPASEIIHDRCIAPWHPLCGIPPIIACGVSATQGIRIQTNSAKFFENMSRPSGHLTAPGRISPETVDRLKKEFETNFSGSNIGRLFVTGDDLKYEAMTIPFQQAQMIEQLQWTINDVARVFKVPSYKLGGTTPSFNNVGALNQDYYSQCLQTLIEAIEVLLDEGLALPNGLGTELDLESLLRMDPLARADRLDKLKNYLTPNEGRESESLPPVTGGDAVYRQQQDFSLEALSKRDAQDDPFVSGNKPGGTTLPNEPSTPTTPEPPPQGKSVAPAEDRAYRKMRDDMDTMIALAEFRKGFWTK